MGNILNRIAQFAECKGISIGVLERSIGASKGVLSRAIAKNTDIQAKWIEAIVDNYPEISPIWLLTGKGEMLTNYDDQTGSRAEPAADDTLYKEMLKEKEKEIAKLNREIGRLQHAVEHLKKGGKLFGFGVEVRTELDE